MSIESDMTVKKVQQILATDGDNGTQRAYERLRGDYDGYTAANGGPQSSQSKGYWESVANKLGPSALPDLAVVWGQQNRDKFTGGYMVQGDLATIPFMRSSDFDRTMSQNLLNQFDTIKHVHRDRVRGGDEQNAITKGDLDERISQLDAVRRQQIRERSEEGKANELMFKLTTTFNGSNESTLFSRLSNKDLSWEHKLGTIFGSTPAGSLGRKELEQSVDDYNRRKQLGEIDQLPREMRRRVESDAETARYLKDNWDKPEVLKLRSFTERMEENHGHGGEMKTVRNYGAITPESLAAAGGFNNLSDMVSRNKGTEIMVRPVEQKPPKPEAQANIQERAPDRPPAQDFVKERAVMAAFMRDSVQQNGEGPYQAAARLLPGASTADVMNLTQSLKKSYQLANSDFTDSLKKLEPGYQWLNRENVREIMTKNPQLQLRFKILIQHPEQLSS